MIRQGHKTWMIETKDVWRWAGLLLEYSNVEQPSTAGTHICRINSSNNVRGRSNMITLSQGMSREMKERLMVEERSFRCDDEGLDVVRSFFPGGSAKQFPVHSRIRLRSIYQYSRQELPKKRISKDVDRDMNRMVGGLHCACIETNASFAESRFCDSQPQHPPNQSPSNTSSA